MKPIDPNDLAAFLDPDAPTVPRPHLVPLSWHDVELHETDDGLCAWRSYTCHVCCGTESDTMTGERCQCAGIGARMRRLTLARIPWAYRHTSMDHLTSEGRQWVQEYKPKRDQDDSDHDKPRGLRFLGRTGRGKTHRMLCAVRGLCERGISARYVSWSLWLDDMRQAFGRDNDVTSLKERISKPEVVALDDIGRQRDTEWAQEQLDQLLERRTLSGGTVLIASNLTDEGLEWHLGDRLWSRIRANTRPVVMTGKDWRAAK
jgi:DNA replication protein DnaC